jgi:hypothetical protein
MDEGTILVYCCPSTFSVTSPPYKIKCTVYTDSVWLWGEGEVLSCLVNHILQEFYTLFLTRFRTYKIASPLQTKMTSKDEILGLVSLKFRRPCRQSPIKHNNQTWHHATVRLFNTLLGFTILYTQVQSNSRAFLLLLLSPRKVYFSLYCICSFSLYYRSKNNLYAVLFSIFSPSMRREND